MSNRAEEQNNMIRPRSGRKFWVFEVQNAIWEALGSVKGSGKGFFARPRRGLLLSKNVVFLYCNLKIEVSIFVIFISVGGGGSGYKKIGGLYQRNKKRITYEDGRVL